MDIIYHNYSCMQIMQQLISLRHISMFIGILVPCAKHTPLSLLPILQRRPAHLDFYPPGRGCIFSLFFVQNQLGEESRKVPLHRRHGGCWDLKSRGGEDRNQREWARTKRRSTWRREMEQSWRGLSRQGGGASLTWMRQGEALQKGNSLGRG